MRIKNGRTWNNSQVILPKFLEMSGLSILGNELNFKLKDPGQGWMSSFKLESSCKIFEKDGACTLGEGSTGKVNRVFKYTRRILLFLGRFPFSPNVPAKGLASSTYPYTLKTIYWAYFIVTSSFLLFVLVMTTLGFANYFLDWNIGPARTEFHSLEKTIFRKNIIPFVLFWGCLVHVSVGNLTLLTNRKEFVDYLNNWNMVMDIVNMDLPASLRKLMVFSNVWVFSFVAAFIIFYIFDIASIARGSSSLIANLVLRPFIPGIHHFEEEVSSVTVFGLVTLLYGIYASRAVLFVYLFQTRILRHTFKVWNERLKEEIWKEQNVEDTFSEKIICEKLYRDHSILVRMVKKTDSVFGTMLIAYYSTQILNMCFELYYMARSSQFYSDTTDIIVAAILFGQTLSFFFTVSLDAAFVNEEAMKGFEVLRSRGLRADDSLNKKHLIYSLEISYSQRIVLTGGKFFAVDRPFIVTVLGAVFTYFVIILQFGNQIDTTTSG